MFNILLQVMDHGKLTDHNGKEVSFRNTILILTTNAGAADMAKSAYGFTRAKREGEDTEAINRLFTPEFRNRLDAVVSFAHLPKEVVANVVDKFIAQLDAQLAERQVTLSISDEARDWLVANGYDEQMGARPMARLIQTAIKTPLADEVLFGRLKNGGVVRVVVGEVEGKPGLVFEFPEGPAQPKAEILPPRAKAKRPAAAKGKRATKGRKGPKLLPPPDSSPPSGNEPPKARRSTVPKLPLKN